MEEGRQVIMAVGLSSDSLAPHYRIRSMTGIPGVLAGVTAKNTRPADRN